MAQELRQLTTDERQLRKDLKIRIVGLAAVERSRRRQGSRQVWLKEGDACTKFFHLKGNGRSRIFFIFFIPCLTKSDGTIVWSHEDKEAELHAHFHNILGENATKGHIELGGSKFAASYRPPSSGRAFH
jgi:hypothetical protein